MADGKVLVTAPFSAEARLATMVLGVPQRVSHEKAARELDWKTRPVRDSVADTAEELISQGVIGPPRRAAAA